MKSLGPTPPEIWEDRQNRTRAEFSVKIGLEGCRVNCLGATPPEIWEDRQNKTRAEFSVKIGLEGVGPLQRGLRV